MMFINTPDLLSFPASFLAFGFPGGYEWLVLLILGLLIFGRRLPEVGRSLGRGIVEFKKGIRGLEEEIDEESNKPAKRISDSTSRQELPRAKANEERIEERNPYATVEQRPREE